VFDLLPFNPGWYPCIMFMWLPTLASFGDLELLAVTSSNAGVSETVALIHITNPKIKLQQCHLVHPPLCQTQAPAGLSPVWAALPTPPHAQPLCLL
jgi:hypothetical protein